MVPLQVIAGSGVGGPRRERPQRIALAYSGGLRASCMIPWLKHRYPGCEVVAITVDVGQVTDPAAVQARAVASGADAGIVVDARADFLRDVALPSLRAGAIHERKYRLGVAMSRPMIAAHQVATARQAECTALAHGAASTSNDRPRFDLAYHALAPDLPVIAPRVDAAWPLHGREQAVSFAERHGVVLTAPAGVQGGNLWQAGGGLDDRPPAAAAEITLRFERGKPVALDGRSVGAVELQTALNDIGAAHRLGGDGRPHLRLVGRPRPRAAAPGGALLMLAHRALEEATVDAATLRLKDLLAEIYADVVYHGQWFSPLREALDAFVEKTQAPVTGEIRLTLYNGTSAVVGQAPVGTGVGASFRHVAGRSGELAAESGCPPLASFAAMEQMLAGPERRRLAEMVQ